MNLPVEIWMIIFEHLHHQPHKARLPALESFKSTVQNDKARECLAVRSLPKFEKQIWKGARSYYGINQASRAAADTIFLSKNLLCCCEPLENMVTLGFALDDFQDSVNMSRFRNTPPPTTLSVDVTHDWIYHYICTVMPSYSISGRRLTHIDQAEAAAVALLRKHLVLSFNDTRSPFRDVRHVQLLGTRQTGINNAQKDMVMNYFAREVEHLFSEHTLFSNSGTLSRGRGLRRTVKLVWD